MEPAYSHITAHRTSLWWLYCCPSHKVETCVGLHAFRYSGACFSCVVEKSDLHEADDRPCHPWRGIQQPVHKIYPSLFVVDPSSHRLELEFSPPLIRDTHYLLTINSDTEIVLTVVALLPPPSSWNHAHTVQRVWASPWRSDNQPGPLKLKRINTGAGWIPAKARYSSSSPFFSLVQPSPSALLGKQWSLLCKPIRESLTFTPLSATGLLIGECVFGL